MSATVNRHVVLAARPQGMPRASDFKLETTPIPEPGAGELLVRNLWMSVDPYMRGRMSDRKSYAPSFEVGKPMEGRAIGRVIMSKHPSLKEGTVVSNMLGWREYFVSKGEGLSAVDPSHPLPAYLGVLGMPGFTGWYGLKMIGKPKAGETLVVSGAAGAVGSMVVQIGKILGCRVVGTAGTDDKCAYLTRALGADAAINYKKAGDLLDALRRACPAGIDIYFENVGGPLLDAVLQLINPFARIPLCGLISEYNAATPVPGPSWRLLLFNRLLVKGFIISDHLDRMPAFLADCGTWLREGTVKYREDIVDGLASAPEAFIGLLQGKNFGKMIVKVGQDPTRT